MTETDFVCFDTGREKFESYNIDVLLRDSLLLNEGDKANEETELPQSEDAAKDVEEELKEPSDTDDKDVENSELFNTEGATEEPDDTLNESSSQPAELSHQPLAVTASDEKDKDILYVANSTDEFSLVEVDVAESETLELSVAKDIPAKPLPLDSVIFEEGQPITQTDALPELKTTLGTTFDAVTSDDELTQRVTPYDDEEESNGLVEKPSEQEDKSLKEPPLLKFIERPSNFEDESQDAVESNDEQAPLESTVKVQDDATVATHGNTVLKTLTDDDITDLHEDAKVMDLLEDDSADEDEKDEEIGDEKEDDEEAIEKKENYSNIHTSKSENDSENYQSIHVQSSETSEQTDTVKHSGNEAEAQEPSSANDTKYTQVTDQKDTTEIQEIMTSEKSEALLETINDTAVDSELDTQTFNLEDSSVLDKPVESFADSTINTDSQKSKAQLLEDVQNTDQDEEHSNEQMNKVKNDIINLLEDTLKTEKSKPDVEDETEVYEDSEDVEDLLEDENAVLASKTEGTDKGEKIEPSLDLEEDPEATLEHPDLVTPHKTDLTKQTNENALEQEGSMDLSISPKTKENTIQSADGADEVQYNSTTEEEPEYSDSVLRLTLLKDHFKDKEIKRVLQHFSLKDLFKIEFMFEELEQKLKSARQSSSQTDKDVETTLESILEVSEKAILDEIDKILELREQKALELGQQIDPAMFDGEAAILDDFQELAFSLHQKYSDSVPLVEESKSRITENLTVSEENEKLVDMENIPLTEATESPEVQTDADELSNVNDQDQQPPSQDLGLEEDGGHFNKNEDIQAGFQDKAEIQRGPQAIEEKSLDIQFGFEMDHSSDSLESPRSSDFHDKEYHDEASVSTTGQVWGLLVFGFELFGTYTEILIASLPEEWQPGPTFHGLPWKPVFATAAVGILTIVMFFWKTVLAVKSRTYLLTEKQLASRIQQLVNEKSDVLFKITELKNMIKQHEEKLKNSENSRSSTQKEFDSLKTSYKELCNQREKMTTDFSKLSQKVANTQKENTALNEKISIMHQEIEKYQKTLTLYDEDCSKVKILMDEAKLREDAVKAQLLSFEKDSIALKEQKKSLLREAKDWKEKHEKLSEEIKVYHKTQKELEDSLVHKENEIDVLSGCIAELQSLEACDGTDHKGDSKVASGEADKKGDPIKLRLKQMMDVSRIKTTLSVIEDERNRCLENYLTEQKARQELEEKFQKVLHDLTNLANDKTHLENQFKNLQQRLEITTELYQQKENALQQKLTQEELERREKETKLSEVDGRAVQAEEELKSLKQKVRDMQDEMQQNERALKAEIAGQEKKAHENWLKARASERALIEERRESANLRQKIVECSDKMADLEHALHKSGPPGHHMPPLRRGDSFGPSPVSCGAPSPPLMIEGPGRPPSAPVGRRNEPFGPRPPSDAHGRFSDLGHPLPSRPEVFAPRTSSPCTQNGSQTSPVDTKAEASTQATTDTTEAVKSQGQESFLPSPIRDSPVTALNTPPKAYGLQTMGGPHFPPSNGPVPPMIRPPNGHAPMIPPRLPYGPHGLPHMDSYRPPPPLRPFAPIPPPFVRGPPPRDLPSMGPLPIPPFGVRDYHSDYAGPRDLHFAPRPFPPGPMPPPGAIANSPYVVHGQDPPLSQPSMAGEETPRAADFPPQQVVTQSTATSTVAEP
ncbi:transport and Golgi organization protein 1 homolog [Trichomycterus rosablanca]|uniref:transport and Golgi organization protein 1 homolog n=1 Tax=Trichomycterus rosablanca TaxID=2290929 RepID=UPI002F350F03